MTITEVCKHRPLSWPELDEQMRKESPENRVVYRYLKSLCNNNPYYRGDNIETVS